MQADAARTIADYHHTKQSRIHRPIEKSTPIPIGAKKATCSRSASGMSRPNNMKTTKIAESDHPIAAQKLSMCDRRTSSEATQFHRATRLKAPKRATNTAIRAANDKSHPGPRFTGKTTFS